MEVKRRLQQNFSRSFRQMPGEPAEAGRKRFTSKLRPGGAAMVTVQDERPKKQASRRFASTRRFLPEKDQELLQEPGAAPP